MDKIKNIIASFGQKWPVLKTKMLSTKGIIYGSVAVVCILVIFAVVQSWGPRQGTILFGMCRAFIEINVPFPQTIRHRYVEQYRKGVRIYYTHTDAFGQKIQENIECAFYQDPTHGVQLELVYFSNIKPITVKTPALGKGKLYQVKQEYIDLFNASKSPAAILHNDPDLSLPN